MSGPVQPQPDLGPEAGAPVSGPPSPAAGESPGGKPRDIVAAGVIVLTWAVAYLPGLNSLPLCDPEESRCAATVADMLRTGDFLVPHLDGQPYFEKPPVFFWLAAAGTALTRDAELGGRIIAALSALGVALCAWRLGRRMFSPAAGLLAGLAAVVCVEYFGLGRWYRMEMLLTLFVTLALACFWIGQDERMRRGLASGRGRWWLGFYVFCALAVLTKGPLGVALPVMVAAAWLLAAGHWRRLVEFLHAPGLALLLLLAGPWFVYMSLKFPREYFQEFIVYTHFVRAADGLQREVLPPGFYLLVVAVGFLPWSILLPAAAIRSFPWPRVGRSDAEAVTRVLSTRPQVLFVWLWAVLVVVAFELAKTKYLHYVLPAFVPLALIVGECLAELTKPTEDPGARRRFRQAQWVALLGAGVLAAGLPIFEALVTGTDRYALLMLPAGLLTMLAVRRSMASPRPWGFAAAVAAGMVFLGVYVACHTMPRMYARISLRSEGLAAAGHLSPGDRVLVVGREARSLTFYAGRPEAPRFKHDDPDPLVEELRKAPAALLFEDGGKLDRLRQAAGGVEFSQPIALGRRALLIRARPAPSTAPTQPAPSLTAATSSRAAGS